MKKLNLAQHVNRWLNLLAGLVFIWLFIFVAAQWIQKITLIGELHSFIRDKEIDATALFYTEVEEFGDAEVQIRNSRNYAP